jgi:hypothetical protein
MKNDILAQLLKSKGIEVTPELLKELDEAAKQQARDNAETLNAMKVDNFVALQDMCINLHNHISETAKNADILPGSAFNVVCRFVDNGIMLSFENINGAGIKSPVHLDFGGNVVHQPVHNRRKKASNS